MTVIEEGSLRFEFPEGWTAVKYDGSSFYRNTFQKLQHREAVDVVACFGEHVLLFMEVKDYTTNPPRGRTLLRAGDLEDMVVQKFIDTLAGLLFAYRLGDARLAGYYDYLVRSDCCLKMVVFVEWSARYSRMFYRSKLDTDLRQTLRGRLKRLNVVCKVCGVVHMPDVDGWTASWIQPPSSP